jgi:hypothetical protein
MRSKEATGKVHERKVEEEKVTSPCIPSYYRGNKAIRSFESSVDDRSGWTWRLACRIRLLHKNGFDALGVIVLQRMIAPPPEDAHKVSKE